MLERTSLIICMLRVPIGMRCDEIFKSIITYLMTEVFTFRVSSQRGGLRFAFFFLLEFP